MGVHNSKLESEIFQFQPALSFVGTATPVETKPDPSWISQLVNQVNVLNVAVAQIHQVVLGQAFTRAAPQGGADVAGLTEEVRKLTQRVDEMSGHKG